MGYSLFDRDFVLNAGGLRIASRLASETRKKLGLQEGEASAMLKVSFKVTRSSGKEPNKAEVSIYNLKKDNRTALQEKKIPTIIEAGYVDNISQIFSGSLEFGENRQDGRDWITTIQAGDGTQKYKSARINKSFKGPVNIVDALKAAAGAMGIDEGNLSDVTQSIRGSVSEFSNGMVLSGKAEQQLDKIAKTMGFKWSIQDEKLQFLGPTQFVGPTATKIAPGTGLIGSPEPGEKGIVRARSLLQPNLLPGHRVEIKSAEVDGFFRIDKVVFSGDTWGDDWFADMECKPL